LSCAGALKRARLTAELGWLLRSTVVPPVLVTVDDLAARPASARLVDVRWKLGDPAAGRAMYEQSHLPGAVFVDMDTDLAGPPGRGGRHPLPSAEQFTAAMTRASIGPDSWVIAYDDGGGGGAPRLWWLLRHFGHPNVSILNGGFPAWLASGQPLEHGPADQPAAPAEPFVARPRDDDFVDLDTVRQGLARGEIHVLDARAPERWRGEVEPVDRIPGRIPGSRNAPAVDNLRDGAFRSPAELRQHYAASGVLDGKPIVVSCGSGVSACVDLVAMEVAGIHDARLFPGSFSSWIAHDLPVETGPGPSGA
jgi:thiosulfate/3-mercaptopyruvate sulfurtransferase